MTGMCKWVKQAVLPTHTYQQVGKTQGQKGQNITIMLYKLAISGQNDSINVIFMRYTPKNAKTKHPPSQTSFMRGKPRTNVMVRGKPRTCLLVLGKPLFTLGGVL
jgi:hypothetical protein